MEKVFHCPGTDEKGNPLILLLEPGRMVKTSSALHPDIQRYAGNFAPEPGKMQVLLTAMGAAEYYGQNINNDLFDEYNAWADVDDPIVKRAHRSLVHDGANWGYKTFEHYARPYMHHQNKDPEKSYGQVKLAVWNDGMKRVELILELDREKAAQVGAGALIEKLDNGGHPDWSMGTKVPWDRCTCHGDTEEAHEQLRAAVRAYPQMKPGDAIKTAHRQSPIPGISITRHDYCDTMKTAAGKLLSSGIRVGVHNDFPRMFDISNVYIGADKIAKTTALLAKKAGIVRIGGHRFPSAFVAEAAKVASHSVEGGGTPSLEKEASIIRLEDLRRDRPSPGENSAKEKKVPAVMEAVAKHMRDGSMKVLEKREKDLPNSALDSMAQVSPDKALSTAGLLGIVLKPGEFQRITLIRMGKRSLADDLDRAGNVFRPVSEVDSSIPLGRSSLCCPRTMCSLLPQMRERSMYAPVLHRRILRFRTQAAVPQRDRAEVKHDLLDKISAAYNGYRENLVPFVLDVAQGEVFDHPDVLQEIFQHGLHDVFSGVRVGVKEAGNNKLLVASILPLTYLLAAHLRRKKATGVELNILQRFVEKHPLVTSMLVSSVGHGLQAARG
jgi:hypothetical protein